MTGIPSSYNLIKKGPASIIIRRDYTHCLLNQGIENPARMVEQYTEPCTRKGRGFVPSVPIKDIAGEKMIVRQYLRGGLIRFLNHDLYYGRGRAEKELSITVQAALEGIPAPEVLAAITVKAAGPFYRAYLVTKELQGCSDLPQYLSDLAENDKDIFPESKTSLLKKVAETVRIMHDRGFYHGDLNLKNILINCSNPEEIYIIDWDKSVFCKEISRLRRSANVRRFCRSIIKLSCRGLPFDQQDQMVFLSTYWHGTENAPTQIKRDMQILKTSTDIRKIFY
jgi:tRNA A-37 threonylcarbamoyl transferase component Bud32